MAVAHTPKTQELIDTYRWEPGNLLPILHALHDRDGYLTEDAIRAVAPELKIPIAELWGTITFYHHFARENAEAGTSNNKANPRVCTGPICKHRGSEALLKALSSSGATPMPCAGRCDDPIPVLLGDDIWIGTVADSLTIQPSPVPPANPGGTEECVFSKIREKDRNTLEGYEDTGGYVGLGNALQKKPSEVIKIITDAKLVGRGGAGFPTGIKWKAVADANRAPKSIVCNADEGEPGCFKDRAILDYDPHAIIEGMIIAAYATGATRGFIYLRYEYPETQFILERAIAEAEMAGYLGQDILPGFSFKLFLRRGAGAYICGEEGSLLNSLEGKHPFPRNRPPFPVTHGFEDLPTAVNNVETLVSVPQILSRGAAWYRNLGLNGHAGTKLISLSGDIQKPGNYEIPIGLPLKTLLNEWGGGALPGRHIQAVTMAGLSGGFLAGDDLDVTLDEPSIRSKGSFLGAGGIMVFDDSRDMVAVAHDAMEFFAHESCGKCFPCRIGTTRLTERLAGDGPKDLNAWIDEVGDIGSTMKATSACGLGMAAPLVTESLLKYFPDRVAEHVRS